VRVALSRRSRSIGRIAGPLIAGLAVALLWRVSGGLRSLVDDFVVMGLDPDRARLVAACAVALSAAAAGAGVGGGRGVAVVTGALAFGAAFAHTFVRETAAAMASPGDQGSFDAGGWLVSLAVLWAVALGTSWVGAVLAGEVRVAVAASVRTASGWPAIRRRRLARAVTIAAPVFSIVAAILVAPLFMDMLNFEPDVHFRRISTTPGGLFGAVQMPAPEDPLVADPPAASNDPASPGPASPGPSRPAASPSPARTPGPGRPARWPGVPGHGRVETMALAAPWRGGGTTYVAVYLPPGYDGGTARYPVIYEVPWSLDYWRHAVDMPALFDGLINAGTLPPEIVAFVAHSGAPLADTECADTVDGGQWLETYMARAVPRAIDARYRTRAIPAARSLLGFSEGAFCAAMLLTRHPDVFGSASLFSGYYEAGVRSNQTVNAWRPFGGDPAVEAAHSPLALVGQLAADVRHRLFVVLSGTAWETFYGPQYTAFRHALSAAGVPHVLMPSPLAHSWANTRAQLPAALNALASRAAANGGAQGTLP
jgi:enterochelin esterase-like enzyme